MLRRGLFAVLVLGALQASILSVAETSEPAGHATPGASEPTLRFGFAGPVFDGGRLGGHQADARDDVLLSVGAVSSGFGLETYKNGALAGARDPDDVENQSTTWDTVLGHNITFTVNLEEGDEPISCSDLFVVEAYIETTAGRLYGFTPGAVDTSPPGVGVPCPGLPGARVFPTTFDLDGSPATVTGTQYPALLSGFYAVAFNAYYQETPSPTNPSGRGLLAGSIQIGFSIQNPELVLDTPAWRLPDTTLRLFTDVGASTFSPQHYAIRPMPLPRPGSFDMNILFPGAPPGTAFERIDHYATRAGPGLEPPVGIPGPVAGETPLDELTDKLADTDDRAAVTVTASRPQLNLTAVPASRAVVMNVSGGQFTQPTGPTVTQPYTPLHVLTIHVPASTDTFLTGVASVLVPVSDYGFPVKAITPGAVVPGVPESGNTEVTLHDGGRIAGGPTGRNAGDMFALQPIGFSHDLITKARLSRDADPNSRWIRANLPHLGFGEDIGNYVLLGMVYGSSDEFYGMSLARRGIGLELTAERLVEGRSGEIVVTVTNLADDMDGTLGDKELEITVNLTGTNMPDGSTYQASVGPIPEGGSQRIEISVTGDTPGTYNVEFTASSGELSAKKSTTVEIISKERDREENRKWYALPGAGLPAALLSLTAAAAWAGRRNRAP